MIGLFKPKGQKLKVTAKGGDRSRTIIQWRMIQFGFLLGLTVLGILYSFGTSPTLQDSSAVALYWSWYNIVILVAAIAVCIERPRLRRHERLKGAEKVIISVGTAQHAYTTADISVGGMCLVGDLREPVGTRVSVQFGDAHFAGTIVRRSEADFAIALDETSQMRSAMVRHVYSGGFRSTIEKISIGFVARKVVARLIG